MTQEYSIVTGDILKDKIDLNTFTTIRDAET